MGWGSCPTVTIPILRTNESRGPDGSAARSNFGRLSCWFLHLPMAVRFLFGFAALLSLVAFLYAEENWRGEYAWNSLKRELMAKGVELDWHKFTPPSAPDDENF